MLLPLPSIVVAFVLEPARSLFYQDVPEERQRGERAGGKWVGFFGLAQRKNYYRPNKRYFSRDECALVRVLFYFFELLPAS